MLRATVLAVSLLAATPLPAMAADAFPWTFNMTPDEVSAIHEFGPYRRFENGDLETYKGLFNGHEENFQFFFADNRLRRIGIYLYEGPDLQAAAQKWLYVYDTLSHSYGSIETPGNPLTAPATDEAKQAFVDRALRIVAEKKKTQMAPAKQPANSVVFSSFFRGDFNGERTYFVVVYFNRPP